MLFFFFIFPLTACSFTKIFNLEEVCLPPFVNNR